MYIIKHLSYLTKHFKQLLKIRIVNKRSISTNSVRLKTKPCIPIDVLSETSYYYRNGLRYVYPYHYVYTSHVKERWVKKSVEDIINDEFCPTAQERYRKSVLDGKATINNMRVDFDRIIERNDVLMNKVHLHEPPVLNVPIEVIHEDDEVIVFDKPSSFPVHPTGRYRHNSILFFLAKEYNRNGLYTTHRLDRLTTGILIFAKTKEKAKNLHGLHKSGLIEKEYLARVVGEFPDEEITVDEPIITASHKIGVCHVNENGKTCSTKFKRLSFNGKSSVVSCKPHQGRMHQIRVHLQWVGHPIVNDPIYNHPTAWVAKEGKERYDMDFVVKELLRTRKDKSYDEEYSTDKQVNNNEIDSTKREIDNTLDEMNYSSDSLNIIEGSYDKNVSFTSLDIGEEYVDPDCTDCKQVWRKPLLNEMVMYLHSLHYKGPNWEYKTSIPKWAKDDWTED